MRMFTGLLTNLRSCCLLRQNEYKSIISMRAAFRKFLGFSSMPDEFRIQRCVLQSGSVQQIRRYAPDAAQANTCWNCKKNSSKWRHMICDECGHLQDVNSEINYFDLLDCPRTFGLQQKELTKCFRNLQAVVHPDKYSNKSAREKNNSADWSSLINKAYKTLSVPIDRGQYMLQLQGKQIPQDNSALNKEFLMEMMERNEEVDNANTKQSLKLLQKQIQEDINAKVMELNKHFDASALDKVIATLVEMKYLHSIQSSINNKYQKMLYR